MTRFIAGISVLLFAIPLTGWSQIPRSLSFQGVIADTNGIPVADGEYQVTFRIYPVESGGTPMWSEVQTVTATRGLFSVILGRNNPLNLNFAVPYWLSIAVGSQPELLPRTELTAAAYSLNAADVADSVVTGRKIAPSQVVRSVNGLQDNIRLIGGTNVSISRQGDSLVVNTAGGPTPWQTSGSNIFFNGGSIGVGTSNPLAFVHAQNTGAVPAFLSGNSNADLAVPNGQALQIGHWDGSSVFTERVRITSNGDVGIGIVPPQGRLNVAANSDGPNPQIMLTETEFDRARISFENSATPNTHWTIGGLTASTAAASQLNFQFQNPAGTTDRVTFLGNGNVGIGNTNPDQELVVGDNLGTSWAVPSVTVGKTGSGGAFEAGDGDFSISMNASNTLGRSRLTANSPGGTGLGKLEIRTDGLSVGRSPGEAIGYMMKIEHESFGLDLARNGTTFDWEMYVAQGNGELRLYFDGTYRGAFSPTDGLYTTSDRRLKTDIQPLTSVLPAVMQLSPSRYRLREANPTNKSSIGFIAQDVERLFPELVSVTNDDRTPGVYSLNYAGFGVLAVKAIQEQQEIIAAQGKEIDALKARLERLERLLER